MTDVLIASLSKIGTLRVLSRTSAMTYKHTSKNLAQIAREVDVDALVEGSVNQSSGQSPNHCTTGRCCTRPPALGGDLRARTGRYFEAAKRSGAARCRRGSRYGESEESDRLASNRQVNPDVLRPYLEARYYASQLAGETILKSVALYQEAIDKDPEFCARSLRPRLLSYFSLRQTTAAPTGNAESQGGGPSSIAAG